MARVPVLLRQPLIHFLLIGAGIFAVFHALDDTPSAPAPREIVVSDEQARQLADRFQSVRFRAPTPSELEQLIDAFIREEVLVREAIALSLDRNDAVIRQRLRQKMEFLTESVVSALNPSDAQLRDHFDANPDRYVSAARIAFDQIFLGDAPATEAIDQALAALRDGTADPALIGARTLLPPTLPLSRQAAVDGLFGQGFFSLLQKLDTGIWDGPVQSGYGTHIVRISERQDDRPLAFEAAREAVRRDWVKAQENEIAEAHYANLLARYTVVRPEISVLDLTRE